MRTKVILCVLALTLTACCVKNVHAFQADGYLDDWGITPFSDWVPDTPNSYYTVEDGFNHPEDYDSSSIYRVVQRPAACHGRRAFTQEAI
jgi:hypothetical protein